MNQAKTHSPAVILFAKVGPGCASDGEGGFQVDPVNQICEYDVCVFVDVEERVRE